MAGGFFSKAINDQKTRSAEIEESTAQAPISMSCPATGCPFCADVVRAGEPTCTFHAGVPKQFWNVVTGVVEQWDEAWKIALLHWQCFNDLEAADVAIQALNALPIVQSRGLRFISEKECKEIYGKGPGDIPMQTLQSVMQAEIDAAITKKKLQSMGNSKALPSQAGKIRSLCKRVCHQVSMHRSQGVEAY